MLTHSDASERKTGRFFESALTNTKKMKRRNSSRLPNDLPSRRRTPTTNETIVRSIISRSRGMAEEACIWTLLRRKDSSVSIGRIVRDEKKFDVLKQDQTRVDKLLEAPMVEADDTEVRSEELNRVSLEGLEIFVLSERWGLRERRRDDEFLELLRKQHVQQIHDD